MGSRLLLWFAVLLLLLLRLMPMLLSFMEVMDTELVWDMLVLAMVLDLAMLVLAMGMDLLPQLLRARVDQRLYFDMGVFYKAVGDCMYPIMFGGPMAGQD